MKEEHNRKNKYVDLITGNNHGKFNTLKNVVDIDLLCLSLSIGLSSNLVFTAEKVV